jgi:fructuronate reductase
VIVHLGLGAFHRAHQAVYTQDSGWEICGVARRNRAVVDALRANNHRYRVISRGPDTDEERSITAIRETLVAVEEPDRVVDRIAAADLVTLTITEGGYRRGDMLDLLARGIAERDEPLTVISCDNVPRNGELLQRLLGETNARFPCTMVDRIVPPPEDPLIVVAEPFSQWVIEDFAGPRPAWPGVEIVADSTPDEVMKLRLLNGTHSALAALGLPKGHATVAEAMADPELEAFVRRLLHEELIPTLPRDPGDYVEQMLERFRNPRIAHPLRQIATNADHKIAQRLIPPAEELRAAGREPVLINQVVRRALG